MILTLAPCQKPSFYSTIVDAGRSRIDEANEPTGKSYVD
jgi:hypothetical protein